MPEKEYFEHHIYNEKGWLSYQKFFASVEGKNHITKRIKSILQFKKKETFLT